MIKKHDLPVIMFGLGISLIVFAFALTFISPINITEVNPLIVYTSFFCAIIGVTIAGGAFLEIYLRG